MRVFSTIGEVVRERTHVSRPLGLVPTMGALHEGHLSLIQRARAESATVVASIFVNPRQFGPEEDYESYPRNHERDLAMLEYAGVDFAFIPPVNELYPSDFDTLVTVERLSSLLEGQSRPGHFQGVATVVTKLFAVVRPDRAYFGQKDHQQVLVIERLNADLNLGVEIVECQTVRERDGLAISSRNQYLNPNQRCAATVLYRALEQARVDFQSGEREVDQLRQRITQLISMEPLATPDYISIANPKTLEELEVVKGQALVSIAVRIGSVRLIDNMLLQAG